MNVDLVDLVDLDRGESTFGLQRISVWKGTVFILTFTAAFSFEELSLDVMRTNTNLRAGSECCLLNS